MLLNVGGPVFSHLPFCCPIAPNVIVFFLLAAPWIDRTFRRSPNQSSWSSSSFSCCFCCLRIWACRPCLPTFAAGRSSSRSQSLNMTRLFVCPLDDGSSAKGPEVKLYLLNADDSGGRSYECAMSSQSWKFGQLLPRDLPTKNGATNIAPMPISTTVITPFILCYITLSTFTQSDIRFGLPCGKCSGALVGRIIRVYPPPCRTFLRETQSLKLE